MTTDRRPLPERLAEHTTHLRAKRFPTADDRASLQLLEELGLEREQTEGLRETAQALVALDARHRAFLEGDQPESVHRAFVTEFDATYGRLAALAGGQLLQQSVPAATDPLQVLVLPSLRPHSVHAHLRADQPANGDVEVLRALLPQGGHDVLHREGALGVLPTQDTSRCQDLFTASHDPIVSHAAHQKRHTYADSRGGQ